MLARARKGRRYGGEHALLKKDNGIMDAAWGPGFVLLAWSTLLAEGGAEPCPLLLAALVTLWGLRLCLHILLRNAGRGEDFRYRNWRETGRGDPQFQ